MAGNRVAQVSDAIGAEYATGVNTRAFCTRQPRRVRARRDAPVRATAVATRPTAPPSAPITVSHLTAVEQHPSGKRHGRKRSLLKKLSKYRKALISGIGSITAVVVSALDSFGPYLSATTTHWIALGVAVATAAATFLTKNAAPADPAQPAPQLVPQEPKDDLAERHIGWAIAGLTVALGGAMFAGRSLGRHSPPSVPFTFLLSPGSSIAAHPDP